MERRTGTKEYQRMNILNNYLELAKIKLFGEEITLTYRLRNVSFFGISKTLCRILQMVKWLGLLLRNLQCVLITDIMETYKAKQVQRNEYTLLKSQLNYMSGAYTILRRKE